MWGSPGCQTYQAGSVRLSPGAWLRLGPQWLGSTWLGGSLQPRPYLPLTGHLTHSSPRQWAEERGLCVCGKEHMVLIFLSLLLVPSLEFKVAGSNPDSGLEPRFTSGS